MINAPSVLGIELSSSAFGSNGFLLGSSDDDEEDAGVALSNALIVSSPTIPSTLSLSRTLFMFSMKRLGT